MRIFLINLDRDADRLDHMNKQLQAHGLTGDRISACYGTEIPDALRPYFLNQEGEIDSFLKAGEVGCYASHLKICQKILDKNITEPVLVMEDDLILTEAFGHLVSQLDNLPDDWEILRLSNPVKAAYKTKAHLQNVGEVVQYWRVPNNTGCYLINRAGAKKFLAYCTLRKRPVDEDLRRPWEHGLKSYGIVPPPTISNIFDSSLDDISGTRDAPARQRFKDAKGSKMQEWGYRLAEFGLLGSMMAIVTTLLFKKRIKARNDQRFR